MRRTLVSSALALALAVVGAPVSTAAPCEGALCAGAARADITPPVTTPMWGYNARAFYSQPDKFIAQHTRGIDTDLYRKGVYLQSEGFHTRLYARALVIRNAAGIELALVQTDLGAMTGEVWRAVATQVAELGIARDNLLISATHTHGGPGAIQQPPAHALLVGDNYDPRVVQRTVEGIVKAVRLAHERLAPAKVAVGRSAINGASVNRSHPPHMGNPCPDPAAVHDHDCAHPGEDGGSPHAIDPIVTMVRADRTDGAPLGVWTSFAAHGTVFGPQMLFTGDNQGVAERLVEGGIEARAEAKGAPLPPQVIAAYANGAEGDIAPACSGYNDFSCSEQTGVLQAEAVLRLYDSLEPQLASDLVLDSRLDVLYMLGQEGTSPIAILGAGPDCPFDEVVPGHGRKCPFLVLSGTGPQWFWIQTMRLGDTVLANIPGEMSVQMARRIRQRILTSPANDGSIRHAAVVGLANDYMAYLTTPEEYDFQWYEGTFTLWGRNEGPLMQNRIGALTDAMLAGAAGPSYLEPPDTSGTQSTNRSPVTQAVSLAHDHERLPGTILGPPAEEVRRSEVAAFSWIGGQPSAEIELDKALVATQRLESGAWKTVHTDEGIEDIVDYVREGLEDHWTVRWDVPLDAPVGRYRFHVTGRAWSDGTVGRYVVTSPEFEVTPTDGIFLTGAVALDGAAEVRATYLPPDPAVNFRVRPSGPTTGSVTVRVLRGDGSTVAGTGGYSSASGAYVVPLDIAAGDRVEVDPGALVDAFGNSNGGPWPPVSL